MLTCTPRPSVLLPSLPHLSLPAPGPHLPRGCSGRCSTQGFLEESKPASWPLSPFRGGKSQGHSPEPRAACQGEAAALGGPGFLHFLAAPLHKRICLAGKGMSRTTLALAVRENKNNLSAGVCCFLCARVCACLHVCACASVCMRYARRVVHVCVHTCVCLGVCVLMRVFTSPLQALGGSLDSGLPSLPSTGAQWDSLSRGL